jgi:hypothetical protein
MPASAPSAPPPAATTSALPPSPAKVSASPAAPAKPAAPADRGPAPDWLADIEGLDPDRPKKPEDQITTGGIVKPTPKREGAEQPEGETKPQEGETVKAPDATVKPVKAAELRTAYDNLKKEKREVLEPKIQSLEAKIKELESRQPEDTKPIVEKMTAIEKRNAELEQHIQFVDYQKSKEFTEKYQQPYTEAWTKAVSDFGQLTVRVPGEVDAATGEPTFTTRQATADDLLYLANLPLSQMDDQAEALFGKSAARVIRHVEKVRELSDAQNKALAEARTKGGEWVKTRQVQMQQQAQQHQKLWGDFNKQIAERFPKMFAPEDGDTEGNELLAKGFAAADRLFAPTAESAFKTPEERIQFHALLRNKIANHDRLARRLKVMQAELAEAKESLAAYEKSEPPAGKGGTARPAAKSWEQEVDEELRKMDRP